MRCPTDVPEAVDAAKSAIVRERLHVREFIMKPCQIRRLVISTDSKIVRKLLASRLIGKHNKDFRKGLAHHRAYPRATVVYFLLVGESRQPLSSVRRKSHAAEVSFKFLVVLEGIPSKTQNLCEWTDEKFISYALTSSRNQT